MDRLPLIRTYIEENLIEPKFNDKVVVVSQHAIFGP
jgi:hypothetical protein